MHCLSVCVYFGGTHSKCADQRGQHQIIACHWGRKEALGLRFLVEISVTCMAFRFGPQVGLPAPPQPQRAPPGIVRNSAHSIPLDKRRRLTVVPYIVTC